MKKSKKVTDLKTNKVTNKTNANDIGFTNESSCNETNNQSQANNNCNCK